MTALDPDTTFARIVSPKLLGLLHEVRAARARRAALRHDVRGAQLEYNPLQDGDYAALQTKCATNFGVNTWDKAGILHCLDQLFQTVSHGNFSLNASLSGTDQGTEAAAVAARVAKHSAALDGSHRSDASSHRC